MKKTGFLVGCLCAVVVMSGCDNSDNPEQIVEFCRTLEQVNAGSIDTHSLGELEGHALVIENLLAAAPPSLVQDFERVHTTIADWAAAVSGDLPIIDTVKQLSDPRLVGSEGRIADYIASHCGVDLLGLPWVEPEEVDAEPICPGWPRIGTPLSFNFFPNLPDIAGSNYFSNAFLISKWAHRLGFESFS